MKRVELLCGCYRKDEAADPKIYAAAIGAVLSEYSDEIVRLVTDPRTGLPSKCQWLPTVKEVRDACQEILDRIERGAARERSERKQLSEREEFEAARANRTPEQQARVDAQVESWKRQVAERAIEELKESPPISPDNTTFLLRQYEAAGIKPVYASNGTLISLDLARSLDVAK